MYVDKGQSLTWLLTVTDKKSRSLISSLIKLNIRYVDRLPSDISFLSDVSYMFRLRSALYIFSYFLLFYLSLSLCLFLFVFFLWSLWSVISFLFQACLSNSFLSLYLIFFLLLPLSLSFSFFPLWYFSISPSLSSSLSHPLSPQQLNPLERFSRWCAVKPATTTWVYHQFKK